MKKRSSNIDNDQKIVDFWSLLDRNNGNCLKRQTGLSGGASYRTEDFENYRYCYPSYDISDTIVTDDELTYLVSYEYSNGYDQTKFCMAQPLSFSENCDPMCEIVKNCETHDNFLCPDDDIKSLMDKCCRLWNDEFECVTITIATTVGWPKTLRLTTFSLTTTEYWLALGVTNTYTTTTTFTTKIIPDTTIKSFADRTNSIMNESTYIVPSMPFESTTELSSTQNESSNRTTLLEATEIKVLVSILLAVLILLVVVNILGIFCVLKRRKRTKSKYKNSEIPRTQSTVSGTYEEYETDVPSNDSEITENLNYAPNCTRI